MTRSGGSTGAVSVSYNTTDGTASSLTDYTATNGTLNWDDGDDSLQYVLIPLNTASSFYGIRSFTLTMSGPTGSATLGTATTVVSIAGGLNAPAAGTIAFSATTSSAVEQDDSVTLLVNRTVGSSGTASMNYTTNNGTAVATTNYTTTTER